MRGKPGEDLCKAELPIKLDHLLPEQEPYISGIYIPEDDKDPSQKELPYDEVLKSGTKKNYYQMRKKAIEELKQRMREEREEEAKLIEKLKKEGELLPWEIRNRVKMLNPTKDTLDWYRTDKHAIRKYYGDDENAEFLTCVCGGKPIIIRGRRLGPKDPTYSIYCSKCHMSTNFQPRLDYARQSWNAHAIKGAKNQVYMKDYKKYVYKIGQGSMEENHYKLKISKADKYVNMLELFFTYDTLYAKKINSMLEEGMSFKNYADLCTYLAEEEEKPNPKKEREGIKERYRAHIKWWRRFFSFERVGKKIIITKVYNEELPWSGDPEYPNRGRRLDSFKPRILGEDVMGWTVAVRKYTPLPEKNRSTHLIYASDMEKQAKDALMKMKKRKEEIEEEVEEKPEEYEVYEDEDWEDIWEEDDLEEEENSEIEESSEIENDLEEEESLGTEDDPGKGDNPEAEENIPEEESSEEENKHQNNHTTNPWINNSCEFDVFDYKNNQL